jgi:hypothetical protein
VGVLCLVVLPVLAVGGVAAVFWRVGAAGCGFVEGGAAGAEGVGGGMFAAPLRMVTGRWYEVGATEYGGPGDPGAGAYGSIADAGQAYLPAHPDSFAELSVLDSNPANGGVFSFGDAQALGGLPYLTALRVAAGGRSLVLYKRDVGYGQGPGQRIGNGEPFRLDLWWQAARELGVSKGPVRIELAGGAAGSGEGAGEGEGGLGGECGGFGEEAPLPLVAGARTRVLADGLAAAGRDAPAAVRRMVAAGNRLYRTAYVYGGGHGASLDLLQRAYDCSSAVSYVLHAGGVLGSSALVSGELAGFGLPGPGRFVTVYANAGHAFVFVGGLRLDTVEAAEWDRGPNAGKPGAKWRVYAGVPGWARWVVRHPAGL